jgi:hypothetical protein
MCCGIYNEQCGDVWWKVLEHCSEIIISTSIAMSTII